jgi:23S rRNA (cytidine2498-2'-O)-methyltransferase
MWIYTTRPGFEDDLREELGEGRVIAPSLVSSPRGREPWPTFARTGFELAAELPPDGPAVAAALTELVRTRLARKPWLLQAWVPDSDATNPLAPAAAALAAGLALPADVAARRVEKADETFRYGGALAQLCLAARDRVLLGALPAADAPTLAPGGRARAAGAGDAPSRAARKLEEAFAWIGRAPEAGDHAVDLGAAPGGWTAVLLQRRVRVIAVDPANMAPGLRGRRGLAHVKASAFEFWPDEPVDWLFCDMAWRPLEVAALLARWGKRKLAHGLVANVKLPMKQRARHVAEVRKIIAGGGWQDVRTRQLYHDREEITLAAWRT